MRRRSKPSIEPEYTNIFHDPITPSSLVSFSFSVPRADAFPLKYEVPDLSGYTYSDCEDVSLKLGWSPEAILLELDWGRGDFRSHPDNPVLGDAVEFFIDTRDGKTAGFPTKFCHHFLFTPEPIEGVYLKEVTKFRGEETRDVAPQGLLKVERKGSKFELTLFAKALYGYDTNNLMRMGFSFRVHPDAQGAYTLAHECAIESHPNYWATVLFSSE